MSLPSGYTKVEYIESHGTEYFDTGFIPNSNTRVVMDIENLATSTAAFFGVRTGGTTYSYVVFVTSATTLRSDYCSATESRVTITLTSTLGRYTIDKNKNVCTANGVTVTNTEQEFECAYNLYLLTLDNKGSVANKVTAKLYSCQIYDNGTLIRDFIPCIDADGVAGLWDDVNSVFYTNAGTGTLGYHISKKHKTLIDGTGYDIKSGRVLIDGTGYSIKKGRTLIDGTGYDIGFEIPASELDIGASIFMNVDGVRTEFLVVHQGTPITNSTDYDDAADGTWVMIKDIYKLMKWTTMSAAAGWPYETSRSQVAKYCVNTFPGLFDSAILALFKTVTVNKSSTTVDDLSCQFFLPLITEVTAYFDTAAKRIAYYNGNATGYWTRSSISSGGAYWNYTISSTGAQKNSYYSNEESLGVRPMGILSAEVIIDSDFNIIIP